MSNAVARLLEPSLRDWLDAAKYGVEFGALEDRSGDCEFHGSVGGLHADGLQVRALGAVLLRSLIAPTHRVRVSDVLRVVTLLSANLTDLGHDSPKRRPAAGAEGNCTLARGSGLGAG